MKCPVHNTQPLPNGGTRAAQPATSQAALRRAIIAFIPALLAASCATTRLTQTASEHMRTDSTFTAAAATELHRQTAAARRQQQEWRTTTLVTSEEEVPAAETTVTLPVQGLLTLPEGAGYTSRDGRATVVVTRRGDSLVVRGRSEALARRNARIEQTACGTTHTSDSLGRMSVHRTDTLAAGQASASETRMTTQKKTTRSGWSHIILWMLAGATLALLLRRTNVIKAAWPAIKGLFT